LLDVGLDAVRADVVAKTGRAVKRAYDLGIALRSPGQSDRRGAMVVLEVPDADRLCAYLKQQGVYTDSRRGALLRLAPFVWNTMDQVDLAFDAIADALRTGAHRTAPLEASRGPVT
jgi:kynureninase